MRVRTSLVLLLCVFACGGCGKTKKSTAELIADLHGSQERDKLIAVRLLPQRQDEAAQIIPALIEALEDEEVDIRTGAAWGLGSFGEQAKDAIPALQAARNDPDARVRKAANLALSRIDPNDRPAKPAASAR